MTLEILKSMAKEGRVFSISQLYEKTHIKKEALRCSVWGTPHKSKWN